MKNYSLLSAAAFGLLLASQTVIANESKKSEAAAQTETTSEKLAMGECHGVNACKGKGMCGSEAGNACAGKNSCKGKGWASLNEKDCLAKKGKWNAGNPSMKHN
jgi:hypothetical protein